MGGSMLAGFRVVVFFVISGMFVILTVLNALPH